MIQYLITGILILLALFMLVLIMRELAKMNREDKEFMDALWWQTGDEIYTDPCETCHRWSECHGVDQENCPLWKKGGTK